MKKHDRKKNTDNIAIKKRNLSKYVIDF